MLSTKAQPELGALFAPGRIAGWRAAGCNACGGSGYRGRVSLFEVVVLDDAMGH